MRQHGSIWIFFLICASIYFPKSGFNVTAAPVWSGSNQFLSIKNIAFNKDNDSPAHGDGERNALPDGGKNGLTNWLNEQIEQGRREIQSMLDIKIFQTNVFFGSIFGFAALLAILYFSKFLLNIFYSACRYVLVDLIFDTFMSLIGRPRKSRFAREHYFGEIVTPNRSEEKKKR